MCFYDVAIRGQNVIFLLVHDQQKRGSETKSSVSFTNIFGST